MDVDPLPGHDRFADQTAADGLAFLERGPLRIVTEQAPESIGVLNDLLWPRQRPLLRAADIVAALEGLQQTAQASAQSS